jgi:ribosomal-protein-alanine N-acetyltransferase
MFPERIETDRLVLEQLTSDNLFEIYEHANYKAEAIDEITRYVTWSPHRSLKETHDMIAQQEENWDEGEGATFVVRPRDGEENAGEFGGMTGIGIDWECRTAELGLWLRKSLWGRGYSAERAAALMTLAFERLDLDLVAVSHDPDNEQSERAIRKYIEAHGGQREGHLRKTIAFQDESVHDEIRYSITQEEYQMATD